MAYSRYKVVSRTPIRAAAKYRNTVNLDEKAGSLAVFERMLYN